MKKCLMALLSLSLVVVGYTQQIDISGIVRDTSEGTPLRYASVLLIHPSDSVMAGFTRTGADGSFLFKDIPRASYSLLITYPGYADYIDLLKDTVPASVVLGTIPLTKKSQLLETVVFQQRIDAIRMKGDTLMYRADSFAVRPGAMVEDLLRNLPGIQVDRNGQITAQGQKVNRVLVDGEEFFSDDPAVVIKNLQADAVRDVQVYDKKSEQAEFTGIDDGERSKTINLTLKPEKKKGYYAKGSLEGGSSESFNNGLVANHFKGSTKVAAYGIMSNSGQTGLGWQDAEQFGGGREAQYDEGSGMTYITGGATDDFNQSFNYEEGLPTAWSAGLHFSDKWRNDRKKINANYRFFKKNLQSESSTISQYILPDTQYFNNQSGKAFSSRMGHQLKGFYDLQLDSLSSLKITITASTMRGDNASRAESSALNADSNLVNRNERLISNQQTNNNFNTTILWRKKFKKTGRTFSLNVDQRASRQDLDGMLQSGTEFFDAQGQVIGSENIDQKKNNLSQVLGINTNAVYTEPLSKTTFLSFNYGYNFSMTENSRNSFNKGASDEYDERDELFSNDFEFRYGIHNAGADIKFNWKKILLSLGSGFAYSDFSQLDLLKDTVLRYSFLNYLPRVNVRVNFKPQQILSLRYNGNNRPPNMDQLQPVRENTDPLNIRIGNPDLRQEFAHNFGFTFSDYKVLTSRNLYVGGYGNLVQNAISTSSVVDAGGKTTLQPINVNGNYNASVFSYYGVQLKKPDLNVGAELNASFNRNSNRVNLLENINNFYTYGAGLSFYKNSKEKFSFSFRPGLSYTINRSSLRPDVVTGFYIGRADLYSWIKLPWKLEMTNSVNLQVREKTDVFTGNNNVVKWDANILRRFGKNNNLECKFSVYDLLNQNIGFNRTANSNFITQHNYLTLRRLFMVGVQYYFTKNP